MQTRYVITLLFFMLMSTAMFFLNGGDSSFLRSVKDTSGSAVTVVAIRTNRRWGEKKEANDGDSSVPSQTLSNQPTPSPDRETSLPPRSLPARPPTQVPREDPSSSPISVPATSSHSELTPNPPEEPATDTSSRAATPSKGCDDSTLAFVKNTTWLFPSNAEQIRSTCAALSRCSITSDGGAATTNGASSTGLRSRVKYNSSTPSFLYVSNVCIDPTGGFAGYNPTAAELGPLAKGEFAPPDDSGIGFEMHFTRLENSGPRCVNDATVFVHMWHPSFDILCCNIAHLVSKVLSALSMLRRARVTELTKMQGAALNSRTTTSVVPTAAPSTEGILDVGQVNSAVPSDDGVLTYVKTHAAPGWQEKSDVNASSKLLRFFRPLSAKNWISVTEGDRGGVWAPWKAKVKPKTNLTLGEGAGKVCVKNAIIGYDFSFAHSYLRRPHNVRVATHMRQIMKKTYPSIGIRDAVAAQAPWKVSIVSRRDVGRRVVLNRDELVAGASAEFKGQLEIEVVTTKGMSPMEQATKFAKTDIFIGAHGAGLTWGMMLPPNAVLIELSNYYRFGWRDGINTNCATIYGSHASLFRLFHMLHFCPERSKKPGKKRREALGDRNRHLAMTQSTFNALLRTALCIVSRARWDNATTQSVLEDCPYPYSTVPCNYCGPKVSNDTNVATDRGYTTRGAGVYQELAHAFLSVEQPWYGYNPALKKSRCVSDPATDLTKPFDPYDYVDPELDAINAKDLQQGT